jgi:1-acyl-sn-glycerol-3-phosphate acyltransferase
MSAAWLTGPATIRLRRALRSDDHNEVRVRLQKLATRAIHSLDVKLDLVGIHRIDRSRAYVVAPLHEGLIDPAVVLQLPLPMVFAMRSEFYEWGGVGPLLKRTGQITVDPERPRAGYRQLLDLAPGHLAGGTSVTVFPQGSVLGIEAAFSSAAFRLARRYDVPVLPVIITGTHRAWEYPFSPRVRFGTRIHMEVMEPVPGREAVPGLRSLERTMKARALASGAQPRHYVPERDGWWDGYRFTIDTDYPELAERVTQHRATLEEARKSPWT